MKSSDENDRAEETGAESHRGALHERVGGEQPTMEPPRPVRPHLSDHPNGLTKGVEIPEPASPRTDQAEEELGSFFFQSLDLLCIAGFDGYFKRLNSAWTTRLGWPLAELVARPFLDFVHPDDRQATSAELGELAGGAETILFENRYRHRDGSYRWLQWNAHPVPGSRRIYAMARDITRQRWLERQVLEIADRERERLGQELHDGLCQDLAGIAALSATFSRSLAAKSESAASAAAAEITELLHNAISQAREMAHGLAPPRLEEAGLDNALEALARGVQHRFSVFCTLDRDRTSFRIGNEVGMHLFRIAQEAVNNAVAHGRTEGIEISLGSKGDCGFLNVRDDGVGLPERGADSGGIGLHTMAYRARLIGGSLEVRRRGRRGTAVTCVFPLPGGLCRREDQDHGDESS